MSFIKAIIISLVLSLSISAQGKQSDREFDGYKGGVKSVLTERTSAKQKGGKIIETNRRKVESIVYDQSGNRLQWMTFHWSLGTLFESVTYGRIDGDKVSIYKNIEGREGVIEAPSPTRASKPSDSRYDFKLKYKYDPNGSVIEEAWWKSDGDLWLRYVYKRFNGQRDELVFEANGNLNQKFRFVVNQNGHDVEMIALNTETDKVEGKEKYEYLQYDAQGNWTKRIEWQADKEKKVVFQLREVKYRTFTYF